MATATKGLELQSSAIPDGCDLQCLSAHVCGEGTGTWESLICRILIRGCNTETPQIRRCHLKGHKNNNNKKTPDLQGNKNKEYMK
jgi:hypothetical protein